MLLFKFNLFALYYDGITKKKISRCNGMIDCVHAATGNWPSTEKTTKSNNDNKKPPQLMTMAALDLSSSHVEFCSAAGPLPLGRCRTPHVSSSRISRF